MSRSKKFKSDNRDALEILRAAFVDAKTPRVAELGTRPVKARTMATDKYREEITPEDIFNQRKEAGIKRQAGKAKKSNPYSSTEEPEIGTSQDETKNEPAERLKIIEEQTKTLPPEDREEFEKLTAQIKAQFELDDQKGTGAPQQVKQYVPPLRPPKQFAEKPQPNEDERGRRESEGSTIPPEKAPDLGNVEAQLEENLAKINDETKVLTQEEVDAILATASKEEPPKTTKDETTIDLGTPTPEEFEKQEEKQKDEDKKTEAGHKAYMRSPKPLSPEDLPKEPTPPQNNPPETEQKKSEETKAAEAWAEWTAKETEKEKQQIAADKKTADEVEAEYKARPFHAGDTALWRTVGPKGVEEYNVLVQGITKDAKGKEQAVVELPDGKEMTLSFGELFSKEQMSSPLTMPTPEEYDRKDHMHALEKEKAALWDEILKTGGTPEQKDRHIALRLAQEYGYSAAAIEEKLKKIDPGMKMAQEELQAAKNLIQTEIDASPTPQPPENLPVEQHAAETIPSSEKLVIPIGKTGPDGAISKFLAKNPEIAKQYGWDGKSDLKKWSVDPTPEKGGWWHARRILKEALKSPEIKKQMKDLGYLKGLSKKERDDEESLVGRYWDMMRRVKEKSSLGIAPNASSLDFSSVQFKKAPRYI